MKIVLYTEADCPDCIEVKKGLNENNIPFENKDLIGVKFNPFTGKWKRSPDISVNYISTFLKS